MEIKHSLELNYRFPYKNFFFAGHSELQSEATASGLRSARYGVWRGGREEEAGCSRPALRPRGRRSPAPAATPPLAGLPEGRALSLRSALWSLATRAASLIVFDWS